MQKKEKNTCKGFTLVELIVVLVILAILAAFMIPALIQYIERSLESSDLIEGRRMLMCWLRLRSRTAKT